MYIYNFEKLEVWRFAKDLAIEIYKITKKYPAEERYGIVSQLNRSAISVASAIAEGSAKASRKEQSHFSQIAYGSLMEMLCQLIISRDLEYISNSQYEDLRKEIEKISNKLNALRNYQLTAHNRNFRLNSSTSQRLNI